jgi:preprotein translocase subunit YajC
MNLSAIIAMAPPPAGTPVNPAGEMAKLIGMVLLFGVMIYFAMIRPQQKRAKQQTEMLKGLRPGDKVLTTAGIIGVVVTVKEKSVTIRSADSKMEITKSAIGDVVERAGESSES